MASSAGNPNQQSPFDMHRLFNPPPPNTTNPPSSYPPPPTAYPAPPPPGPFSYPPPTTPTPPFHHYLHYPHQDPLANMHAHRPISYPTPLPPLNPNPMPNNPNPNANSGARLMALLTPTSSPNHDPPLPTTPTAPMLPPIGATGPLPPPPARIPSSKLPKGRHLIGDRVEYDVDVRLPGETLPQQLEVTPITKYVSDPGLVLGRQIAVNRTYICYGLKLGAIRVLNINTALRSLLRGHTQV